MSKPERLDGMAVFGVEAYGFNKEQVSRYIAEIDNKYRLLFDENIRLREKLKALKNKDKNEILMPKVR